MFPNVRLLIGALFITILVLSCEFGVFAALRVNREPLSRLTSESAPLQLVAGKNAAPAVPISWSAPRNAQAPERPVEVLVPSNDVADGALNTNNQPSPPALQTALAALPAAPAPAIAPAADAALPIAQAPTPPPAKMPAPGNETVLATLDASGVPAQQVSAPAVGATVDNAPPEQAAAGPAALAAVPAQQTPAAEIAKPAEAAPPQAASASQPHETAAQGGEPPAASAPVIAAIAPAAAEPAAASRTEITGSVPNAAMPETAAPKAAAPHAKPLSKIVHKPAAKKPHKIARAPAQPQHLAKKRIARARPAAAAATVQPATDFNNPVFQSAPEFQRPTKSRRGAKTTATNNGFGNTFGAPFGAQ